MKTHPLSLQPILTSSIHIEIIYTGLYQFKHLPFSMCTIGREGQHHQGCKDLWLCGVYGEENSPLGPALTVVMNMMPGKESRTWSDRLEWKLSPILFQKINRLLGPLSLGPACKQAMSQLPLFLSWKLNLLAVATDMIGTPFHENRLPFLHGV